MAYHKKVGRKPKYSAVLRDKIINNIRNGRTQEDTAYLVGIQPQTLSKWKSEKPEFHEAIKTAEAQQFKKTENSLLKHGKHSWQALAWWLERRRSDVYSLKTSVGLASGSGVQIAIISGGYVPPALLEKQPLQGITGPNGAKQLDKPEAKQG